jgi:flagellar biosynthesis protein FlhF
MNVKRYRAATMREALEQVKQELGEDALVLDTKRVTSGGILGLGGREMVEIRVAAEAPGAERPRALGRGRQKAGGVNLTDDEPATPAMAAPRRPETAAPAAQIRPARATSPLLGALRPGTGRLDARPQPAGPDADRPQPARDPLSAFAAIAARAYAQDPRQAEPKSAAPKPAAPRTAPLPGRGIELAETAPRVVHRGGVAPLAAPSEAPAQAPAALAGELERLRAELREMKLSIGMLSTRQAAPAAVSQESATVFEADPEICDSPFYEVYLGLTAAGLPPSLAHRAVRAADPAALRAADPLTAGRAGLAAALPSLLRFAEDPLSAAPGTPGAPSAIALIGPTGVGKTTTIAKLAARVALRERRRVELVTLDTYRIAAVEQLKTYAEIIGAGCHIAGSVLELDSIVRRFAGEATVLIDTTGRSPHDLADQIELADYLRASEAMLKCLVLQATTHPTDAWAAAKKYALYGPDWLILTKLDESARPAGAVSIAADAGLPLVYLSTGQRVPEDIERATAAAFADHATRARAGVAL